MIIIPVQHIVVNVYCLNCSVPADARMMLAVVVILAVCGYCMAQCSTTTPVGLTVPWISYHPFEASNNSRFY